MKPVTAEEALTFNTSWKTPSVITYQLNMANNKIDVNWRDKLDSTLLYYDLKYGSRIGNLPQSMHD